MAILFGAAGLFLFYWFVSTFELLSWDFRNNLWGPAYLLWQGEAAYNIDMLFEHSNAIWFPQIIGIFSPLGLLSQYQAANIWLIINIVLLVLLTGWSHQRISQKKPQPLALGILLLFVFLFPPTIRLLIMGQAGVILAAALMAGALALEKRRLALSGFFFALAMAKPQLCLLVLPSAVSYLLICQRDWRAAVKLTAYVIFFSFALTIPLWLGSSDWPAHFLTNFQRNHQWYQPAIYSQLTVHFGSPGQVMWFFLFSLALGLSIWLWSKFGPTQAVLWSLALTTFVSPYVWSWDFVLLLPLSIDTGIRSGGTLARLTLAIAYGLCFGFTILSQRLTGADDSALWWLPFVIMGGILLSRHLDRKYDSQGKAHFAAA